MSSVSLTLHDCFLHSMKHLKEIVSIRFLNKYNFFRTVVAQRNQCASVNVKRWRFDTTWGEKKKTLYNLALIFFSVTLYPVYGRVERFQASHGSGAQGVLVNASGCGFDPHSRKLNTRIYLHL